MRIGPNLGWHVYLCLTEFTLESSHLINLKLVSQIRFSELNVPHRDNITCSQNQIHEHAVSNVSSPLYRIRSHQVLVLQFSEQKFGLKSFKSLKRNRAFKIQLITSYIERET